MGIEKGNDAAMKNLGYYYEHVEKNYDEMKKYYLMAIEKGDDATNRLKKFVKNIEKVENYKKTLIMKEKKECLICKDDNHQYIINLNCENNKNHYDHYYCHNCFKKWYENNDMLCLACGKDFVFNNFILLCSQNK